MIKTILCLVLTLIGTVCGQEQSTTSKAKLSEEIQALFKAQSLDKKYEVSSHLKPSYLHGDFTGDGKSDVAVLVKDQKTGKIGIAFCNVTNKTVSIVGAGKDFGNGGDNFDWIDVWSVTPKAKLRQTVATLAKGDALFIEKSESASALIYWNGAKYVWRQQGD
ncbi:MAG: hypothetical protein KA368_13345 [Acidobacteria bacterium]|nr:hypothetical protein [Acidobacteriota bacterium]